MIRAGRPTKLMKWLKEREYEIVNKYPGVYNITGKTPFATQIVVTKELDNESHMWLMAPNDNIKREQIRRIRQTALSNKSDYGRNLISDVLHVSIRVNLEEYRHEEENGDMDAFYELFAPQIERTKSEGREEGGMLKLIKLICTKLSRGQKEDKIAEDLIEDEKVVTDISNIARRFAPEYDAEKIFAEYKEKMKTAQA